MTADLAADPLTAAAALLLLLLGMLAVLIPAAYLADHLPTLPGSLRQMRALARDIRTSARRARLREQCLALILADRAGAALETARLAGRADLDSRHAIEPAIRYQPARRAAA